MSEKLENGLLITILIFVTLNRIFQNVIGTERIASVVWSGYLKLCPMTSTAKEIKSLRENKKELLAVYRERSSTSSQDQFAKWARLNRKYDKLKAAVDKQSAAVGSIEGKFLLKIRSLLWVSLRLVQVIISIFYRSEPVFWLPYGWFPYWIEWILAFSSAPVGSVGVMAWFSIVGWAVDGIISAAKSSMSLLWISTSSHSSLPNVPLS